MVERQYRGIPLSRWLTRTPYASLAKLVHDPVMRLSKGNMLYMTGFNEQFGCEISLHYRKKRRDQPQAPFVMHSPFGQGDGLQGRWTFSSLDEVEASIREDNGSLEFLVETSRERRETILKATRNAQTLGAGSFDETDHYEARHILAILEPGSITQNPWRYAVPAGARSIICACLRHSLDPSRLDLSTLNPDQWTIVERIALVLETMQAREPLREHGPEEELPGPKI